MVEQIVLAGTDERDLTQLDEYHRLNVSAADVPAIVQELRRG